MRAIFESLKKRDLLSRRGRVNELAIDTLSKSEIVELAETIVENSESEEPDIARNNIFTHSAGSSLAAGRGFACEGLDHRLEGVERLARFAVMYSDKVYIENFFSGYEHLARYRDEIEVRMALQDDLQVLAALKPLLENHYVEFFTPHEHFCRECLLPSFGVTQKKLDSARRQLSAQYLQNLSAEVVHLDHDLCEIEYAAPEPYLPHPIIWSNEANYRGLHEAVAQMPRIIRAINKGDAARLSKAAVKKLELHHFCASKVADSASYGILTANLLNASFLTDNALDISFLRSITKDKKGKSNSYEERNRTAFDHLTSLVPFAADVSISSLIKIRKREEEAFIKYRQALNEAIDTYKSNTSSFTERDARALYSDVIAPGLANLNQSVQVAKRDLVKKAYRSVIAVVGAISFGLYTGFIPTELAEMAKVIGFTKIATDILGNLLPVGDAEESIKTEDLYFLWQVRKLGKSI